MNIEETSFKCFTNVRDLKQSICFIYTVLSRIQLCRDYALFALHNGIERAPQGLCGKGGRTGRGC